MTETIAGIGIPDTDLVRAVTAHVREHEDDLLFHHSRRVFLFGALMARRRGLEPDLELLYAAAMFHDMGLTPTYSASQRRFEVDGADAARRFLLDHGVSAERAATVWTGIALHTTPGIPEFMSAEIASVTMGVETDVLGIWYDALSEAERAEVVAAHPRPDFKNRILAAFTQGNVHRPDSTFGNVNADVLAHFMPGYRRVDFVDVIRSNRWPE